MMDRDEMEALTGHPPSDLIHLSHVTEPSLLYILKKRFAEDELYFRRQCIAANPFKMIEGLYDEDDSIVSQWISQSQQFSAYLRYCSQCHASIAQGENQSMIVSGESGAGKRRLRSTV